MTQPETPICAECGQPFALDEDAEHEGTPRDPSRGNPDPDFCSTACEVEFMCRDDGLDDLGPDAYDLEYPSDDAMALVDA